MNEHDDAGALRQISRVLTPQDRAATPYLSVPFEVPPGTRSVEILLEYDTAAGVIDIGCEGAAGWRGWSGGARRHIIITENEATWGYVPGPLEPGVWAVVLGLHKVPANGLAVTLSVRVPAVSRVLPDPPAPLPAEVRRPAADRLAAVRGFPEPQGLQWFAADFHAHTLHSDGQLSVRQLAALAVSTGLDVLAVTDHNTISHHACLPEVSAEFGVFLLPGQEVTTGRGHANVFGSIPWIDFRQNPATWFARVTEAGGVGSVNHPVSDDCAWQWEVGRAPECAEIMHSSWRDDRTNTGVWAWWNAWGFDACVPIGGSDFHDHGEGVVLGTPTTWVLAERADESAILDALRAGRTSLSWGGPVSGAVLLRVGADLHVRDAAGAVLVDAHGIRTVVELPVVVLPNAAPGPWRLETPDRDVLAIAC